MGCATVAKIPPPAGGRVTTYVQSSKGDAANLYWFETPSGPVLIDAPLLTSEAKKLRGSLVKPYRIYITAPRPERFGGLAALRDGDIPVYSTPAIASEIKDKGDEKLAAAQKRFGNDVPSHVDAPTPAVEERTSDMVGEVELEFLPVGPARSEASMALYLIKSRDMILGELVNADEHLDISGGRAVQWQQKLMDLRAIEAQHVYPGHGRPGGPELINQTLEYLSFFIEAIKEKAKPGQPAQIAAADAADVKRKLIARFPKHGAQSRIDASIAAEYATQIAALPPAPAATPTEPGPAQAPAAPPAADAKKDGAPTGADGKPAITVDAKEEKPGAADKKGDTKSDKKKPSKKKSK